MLRDYQIKIVDEVQQAFRKGHKAPLIVSPTGSGKTATCLAIAEKAIKNGKRVLWIAHREELCKQTLDASPVRAGTIGATLTGSDPGAPLQIAMIQTLQARALYPQADLAILDEAHHFSENTYADYCKHYTFRVGATATPSRSDGAPMGNVFDTIVLGPTVLDLTNRGLLVPCRVLRPPHPLKPGEIAQRPVDAYQKYTPGEKCLVFAQYIKTAREYQQEFLDEGIPCSIVTQHSTSDQRKKAILDLESGHRSVCINVATLTEGFDVPAVSSVILARGTGHAGLFLQIVGRALRPFAGKSHATLLDLRGSVHVHGPPDAPRIYSLDGTAIARADVDPTKYCAVCGTIKAAADGPCGGCGYVPDVPESPTVVGAELEPYAAKRADVDTQRAATLARWIQLGRIKQYKPGWAYNKYKVVYGEYPPDEVEALAREWS